MTSVDNALNLLRGAILNSRIYPTGSQIIDGTVTSAFNALTACLEETPQLTISDSQDKLMLNDTTELQFKPFLRELKQHDVQIMTVSKGLTRDEVGLLAQGFAKSKKDPDLPEGLQAWLSKQAVRHAEVSRAHYVAVREGEVVARQVKTLFGRQNYDMTSALVSRLEQSLRDLEGLPEGAIEQRKKEIISDLTGRSVNELRTFVESDLPEEWFKDGFSQTMVESLSLDKSEELFNEIIDWASRITPQEQSEDLTQIKILRLRRFLKALIDTPGSRLIPTDLLEKLAHLRLINIAPSGFLEGTESFSVVAYVEHLLALPSRAVLRAHVLDRLAPVVQMLTAMQAEETLRKLMNRVIVNLVDIDPSVRITAVKTLFILVSKIQSAQRRAYLDAISDSLMAMAEVEGDSTVYEEIARSLVKNAQLAMTESRLDEAIIILQKLARHRTEGHPQFRARNVLASSALSQFAGDSSGMLCAHLQSADPGTKEQVFRILQILGEEGVSFLIETAARQRSVYLSNVSAATLRQMGTAARDKVLQQIHVGMPADMLLRLFAAVEVQNDSVILRKGLELLQHPDRSVRIQALTWVVAVSCPESDQALVRLLDDPEPTVRLASIREIAERDKRTLGTVLLLKLPGSPPEVQDEILLTLARWKMGAVLPVATDLLLGPKKLFGRRRGFTPSNVRARCAWVIGQFLPNQELESVLRQALSDHDPVVRRTVETALQNKRT